MSENENYRTDDAPAPQANPGPREVPGSEGASDDDLDRTTEDPASERAIPGEYPKDDPDLKGEERFDAG